MLNDYIIISIHKTSNTPPNYCYYIEDENGYHKSLSIVAKEAFKNYEKFLLEQLDLVNQIKLQEN